MTNPYTFFTSGTQASPLQTFGLYSASGFDLVTLFSKLANRPNKIINLGPIDTSCSFLVVSIEPDYPIVYASPTFEQMTGYNMTEILGRNCRFLQSPDGNVPAGSVRRFTDNSIVSQMKRSITLLEEFQVSLINYKKSGEPFINLFTCIPLDLSGRGLSHYVGFQIDLVEQPLAVLERMKDGTYSVNYSTGDKIQARLGSQSIQQPSFVQPDSIQPTTIQPSLLSSPTSPTIMQSPTLQSTVIQPTMMQPSILQPTRSHGSLNTLKLPPLVASSQSTSVIQTKSPNPTSPRSLNLHDSQSILDHHPDHIHLISSRGKILYSTSQFEKNGSLVGHSIEEILHPADTMVLLRELRKFSEDQPPLSLMLRYRLAGGYIWMQVVGSHFVDNKTRGVSLVARPIAVPVLDRDTISKDQIWFHISGHGLILYSSVSEDHVGRSLTEFVEGDGIIPSRKRGLDGKDKPWSTIRQVRGMTQHQLMLTFYPQPDKTYFVLLSTQAPSGGGSELLSCLDTTRPTNMAYETGLLRERNRQLMDELQKFGLAT